MSMCEECNGYGAQVRVGPLLAKIPLTVGDIIPGSTCLLAVLPQREDIFDSKNKLQGAVVLRGMPSTLLRETVLCTTCRGRGSHEVG